MRRASDLPRRPPRHSRLRASGRYLLLGAALLFLFVVVFGRAVARFYVDELWFDALGQSGVFWTTLRAKLTLFAIFFALFAALAAVNLAVADKLAPSRFPVNVHPYVERFHQTFGRRLRLYRFSAAGLIALLMALPVTTQWQSWLLYRHGQSFNIPDAQFGVDVGFYVFELPFLSFVLDWLFFAVVLVMVLTFLTHLLNGAVVFAAPVPTVGHAMKGHLAVLLAVLAALKAADYWVRRYETTNAQRGFVQGPTYSVVHAQLPALLLLAFVALVTAGLYLSTLKTQSWRIPLVASAVWLVLAIVGGYVYPAVVQSLVVRPNQKEREAPYIANNVEATRQAMGLTLVNVRPVTFGTIGGSEVEADLEAVRSVRLLSPTESRSRFQQSQGNAAGLVIADLDIDRYATGPDSQLEQVLIAARELDVGGAGNQSWQGRHLINTHGCNLVRAPASRVAPNGQPIFEIVDVSRPELYFSPSLSGWAVAGSEADEQGCGAQETGTYTGSSGVVLSSWLRRAAFSLAFMDYNLIGSGAIDGDSQMLWNRNVRDRVAKLAPFLTFDGDPYPVVVGGRILWVVDAYTSTSRYPSAEAVGDDVVLSDGSGIPRDANYIRNSVKAVVDAYDGSVALYVVDDQDPIVAAWASAFPHLFTEGDEMPAALRDHLRYPEDLFRVQTNVYSKYQLEPGNFFDRQGAWSVAQALNVAPRDVASTVTPTATAADAAGDEPDELATEASSVRFVPYYTLFDGEFVLLRPFVPFSRDDSRTELQAYMTASSDGQLTVYQVVEPLPPGPRSVASTMEADPQVSEQVTFFNQARGGTNVRFGDLQLVPITGDDDEVGALWVRPFYVSAQQDAGSVTDYKYMIVSYGGRVAIDATISGALRRLFPTFGGDVGERADGVELEVVDLPSELGTDQTTGDAGTETTGSSEPPTTSALAIDAGADEVLVRVNDLLAQADAALARGDLGTYQEKVDEAATLLARYLERSATSSATTPASTAAP